jgi:hypothetical protein
MKTTIAFINKKWMSDNNLTSPHPLDECRGLASCVKNEIFINLSAKQWKTLDFLGVDELIYGLCDTIVHETVHILIGTKLYCLNDVKNIKGYTAEGEERVCALMAEQEDLKEQISPKD